MADTIQEEWNGEWNGEWRGQVGKRLLGHLCDVVLTFRRA